MEEAIKWGPHRSALSTEAIAHFVEEAADKVSRGQAQLVKGADIKDDLPTELKISLIAAIPHYSWKFRSILDLTFPLRLTDGAIRNSVNATTEKTAPAAAIDQIGCVLKRFIHAFAEIENEDANFFMAKFNVDNGFLRLDCKNRE